MSDDERDATDQTRPDAAVRLAGAGKRFDDTWVLRDVDLRVEPGTILGLIGPSGSGKTTAVRLITGVLAPDEGSVSVFGATPGSLSRSDRQRIGYLPQHPVLFGALSLWENLQYHASLVGLRLRGRDRRLSELLELVDLTGHEGTAVDDASGGMQRRTALVAAMLHAPDLLLLDEPTAGIDPILRTTLWDRFRALRDDGQTLVVTTQYVGEAAHCDRVALLSEGRLVQIGTPDELRRAALGGEQVELGTREQLEVDTVRRLLEQDGVSGEPDWLGPRRVRLIVDDAGVRTQELVRALEDAGLTVEDSRHVELGWDDAFVLLVERDKAEREPSAPDGESDEPDGPDEAAPDEAVPDEAVPHAPADQDEAAPDAPAPDGPATQQAAADDDGSTGADRARGDA